MNTAIDIADYITHKGVYGRMHLQKLLYYAQAWSLVWTGRPLFADTIEAWAAGPVVATVWRADGQTRRRSNLDDIPDDVKRIVDAVYDFYGSNGGKRLSVQTHREQPWIDARGETPEGARSQAEVSQSSMRTFYTKQAISATKTPVRPQVATVAEAADVQATARKMRAKWAEALEALAHV